MLDDDLLCKNRDRPLANHIGPVGEDIFESTFGGLSVASTGPSSMKIIAFEEHAGIDVQILSHATPSAEGLEPSLARELTRQANCITEGFLRLGGSDCLKLLWRAFHD